MAGVPWHDSNYKHRMPIIVTRSATATYFSFAPAKWLDVFWDANGVQSTGYDVAFYRATSAAGTLVDHNRASWTYATKNANFNVAYTDGGVADSEEVYWAYWGYSAATDLSTAVTTTTETATLVSVMDPRTLHVVDAGPAPPGETTPTQRVSKTTTNAVFVAFDLTRLLGEQIGTAYAREASAWVPNYFDINSTTGTGVYSGSTRQSMGANIVRLTETDGHLYAWVVITGGTVDVDYTLALRGNLIGTTPSGNIPSLTLDARALVQVRDPAE